MEQSARIISISLENFKGISKPVTVPLRPITLLFGKNSAGKSTILQAMLYTLEVIRTGNADIDKVQLGGDAISLGGFRNLVHKHDLSRTTRLRFDLQLDDDGLEPFPQFRFEVSEGGTDKVFEPSIDQFGTLHEAWVELSIAMMDNIPTVTKYVVGLNGMSIATITNTWPGAYGEPTLLNPNWEHPLLHGLTEAWEGINTLYSEPDPSRRSNNPTADDLVWHVELEQDGCIPCRGKAIALYDDFEDNDPNIMNMLWGIFSQLLVRPAELLEDHLSHIRYIGPIREIPVRGYQAPIITDKSRWANGLAAWDALYSANESPLQKEQFMAGSVIPRLNSRDAKMIAESEQFTLQKVNAYIRDILQLGYELRWKDVIAVDANHELFDLLDNLDEGQASLFQNRYSSFREYMLGLPVTRRLSLHDLNNAVDVTPSDIGVGVSQVVPVVVGALAKTAENKFPSILSIEQPELHIHPAVQCALGDLFIREKSDSRIFLLETHSEHLILRFLRRISETTDNELEDPSLALRPDELGVIYVNTADNELTLTKLPVDTDGEFTTRWPEGFFEERATELFGESDAYRVRHRSKHTDFLRPYPSHPWNLWLA